MGLLACNPYLFWDHARSLGLAVGMRFQHSQVASRVVGFHVIWSFGGQLQELYLYQVLMRIIIFD